MRQLDQELDARFDGDPPDQCARRRGGGSRRAAGGVGEQGSQTLNGGDPHADPARHLALQHLEGGRRDLRPQRFESRAVSLAELDHQHFDQLPVAVDGGGTAAGGGPQQAPRDIEADGAVGGERRARQPGVLEEKTGHPRQLAERPARLRLIRPERRYGVWRLEGGPERARSGHALKMDAVVPRATDTARADGVPARGAAPATVDDMRNGATLLELMVVLAIIAVLAGLLVPGTVALGDRLAVEHEVARLLGAYRTAWSVARAHGRLAVLRVHPETLAVRTVPTAGAPDTALVWLVHGPARGGVRLESPAHTAVFGPSGITMGAANARHVLVRGRATRSVIVSRLGRIRVTP